jgi:hypothetical protein
MDVTDFQDGGYTHTCLCGRSFSQSGALSYHNRSCKLSKKRLNEALGKAKEAKKKRRVEVIERMPASGNSSSSHLLVEIVSPGSADTMPAHAAGDITADFEVDIVTTEVWKTCKARVRR